MLFGLLVLAAVPVSGQSLTVDGSADEVTVSVVRRVELDYFLVSSGRPIEFSATGPTWLRVYTRLWWPEGASGTRTYRLSLWQEDAERPLEFETGRSKSSYGTDGHPVGKWRSFYIQVPEGKSSYRLECREGAVAVRFAFQRKRPWSEVRVEEQVPVTLTLGVDSLAYHRVETGSPARFSVRGPGYVRIRTRLDYDPSMVGAQNFVLTAAEGEEELVQKNFRVTRSGTAHYIETPELVPSTERATKFRVGEGTHRLTLVVNGTLARSAGVRVEFHPSEKYE